MCWLIVATLVLSVYVAIKMHRLNKGLRVLAEFMETQFKAMREAALTSERTPLPFGWFDDGFPPSGSDEEDRVPIENPELGATNDRFSLQIWIAEYLSIKHARERVHLLRG